MTQINSSLPNANLSVKKVGPDDIASRIFGDKELSKLQSEARTRAHQLINEVEFVGFAGAAIKDDGSYELIIPTLDQDKNEIPESVRDKLREMVTEAFEGDEELQGMLTAIKDHTDSKQAAAKETPTASTDTFEFSNFNYASLYQKRTIQHMVNAETHELDPNGTLKLVDVALSPTKVPFGTKDCYDKIDRWIKDGGENPVLPRIYFKA